MKSPDLMDEESLTPSPAMPEPPARERPAQEATVRLAKAPPTSEKIARLRWLLSTGAYVADHVTIARRILDVEDLDGDDAGTSSLAEHAAQGEPPSGMYQRAGGR